MINIGSLVQTTLATVGCQVCLGAWRPDAAHPMPPVTYIVFTFMTTPVEHDDDGMRAVEHYVYLHIWSSGDYSTVQAALRTLMLAAGFALINEGPMRYEQDTKMFDLACDYVYWEEFTT
jgi:hypothetical protein